MSIPLIQGVKSDFPLEVDARKRHATVDPKSINVQIMTHIKRDSCKDAIEAVFRILIDNKEFLNGVNLATAVYHCSAIAAGNSDLKGTIKDNLSTHLPQIKEMCLSFDGSSVKNLLVGLHRLDLLNEELYVILAARAESLLNSYDPISLSIIASVMGNYRCRHPQTFALLSAISTRFLHYPGAFEAKSIALIAKAHANLDVTNELLFKMVSVVTREKIKDFALIELSFIAWSFNHFRLEDEALFHSIAVEILQRQPQLSCDELTRIFSAYAAYPQQEQLLGILYIQKRTFTEEKEVAPHYSFHKRMV